MTSTRIVFLDEVNIQQGSAPPVRIKVNKHNKRCPRDEVGNIDVKNGKYDTNNQPEKATFEYKQRGRFCLGESNIESKNGTITGKQCPVFDY